MRVLIKGIFTPVHTKWCQMINARVQELRDALRDGTSLEELWKVARGDIQYKDFKAGAGRKGSRAKDRNEKQDVPKIPEELVRQGHGFLLTNPLISIDIASIVSVF